MVAQTSILSQLNLKKIMPLFYLTDDMYFVLQTPF